MASDYPELTFNDVDDFTADRLNAAMATLDARLRAQEALRPSYDDAVDTLNRFGLVRLDQAIQPVYNRLMAIGRIGVIFQVICPTPNRLGQGLKTWIIPEDRRLTFAPAAYLQIVSTGDGNKSMYGSTQSYDDKTGELIVRCDQVRGIDEGVISSWSISAAGTPVVFSNANELGVYTQAQSDQKIADAISQLRGSVPADRMTLAAINAALAALTDGAVNIRNFAQVSTAIANRLQVDGAQGLNATAKSQALSNLGVSDFVKTLLVQGNADGVKAALGITPQQAVDLSAYATKAELGNYASKGDLGNYASKGDLGSYLPLAGGNVGGQIIMDGRNGGYRVYRAGQADFTIKARSDNRIQIIAGTDPANEVFSIGTDGSIQTKQIGDVNARIEQRAQDFSNARKNECVLSVRWTMAGELGNDWNINNGFQTPYGGAAIVDRASGFDMQSNQTPIGFRWRYLEIYIPASGGWVRTGYAS